MSCVDGVVYRAWPCQSCPTKPTHRLQAYCASKYGRGFSLLSYLFSQRFSHAGRLVPALRSDIPSTRTRLPLLRVTLQTTDEIVPII